MKVAESDRTLLSTEEVEPVDIPIGCPSSPDLRLIASWLSSHYPVAALLDLVRAKDYTAAHELAGAHDAITAINVLAHNLDEAERDSQAVAEATL